MYEMGNSINDEQPVKKIDMLTFNIVVEKVKKFLDSKNEAVAILQEIPFKCNIDGFKEHILFHKFLGFFPDDKYDMYYNVSSEKQANHICNNWKKNASHMYAEVINLLTTYKK